MARVFGVTRPVMSISSARAGCQELEHRDMGFQLSARQRTSKVCVCIQY